MKLRPLLKKYKHIVWALYVPLYAVGFFMIGSYQPEHSWVSYSVLDDLIPFVPEFIFIYWSWFPLLLISGLYLLFVDADAFRRFMWSMIFGFTVAIATFWLFPSVQELRPQNLDMNDFFERLCAGLYSVDDNFAVMPSGHVIGSFVALFALWDCKRFRRKPLVSISITMFSLLICASTVLMKQHSILDVYGGLAVSAIMFVVVFVLLGRRRYPDLAGLRAVRAVENTLTGIKDNN